MHITGARRLERSVVGNIAPEGHAGRQQCSLWADDSSASETEDATTPDKPLRLEKGKEQHEICMHGRWAGTLLTSNSITAMRGTGGRPQRGALSIGKKKKKNRDEACKPKFIVRPPQSENQSLTACPPVNPSTHWFCVDLTRVDM